MFTVDFNQVLVRCDSSDFTFKYEYVACWVLTRSPCATFIGRSCASDAFSNTSVAGPCGVIILCKVHAPIGTFFWGRKGDELVFVCYECRLFIHKLKIIPKTSCIQKLGWITEFTEENSDYEYNL